VSQSNATREELESTIELLREENARLKEEIRKIRRETNEVPPHYQ
jgi:cell division protein FtsB